jgi:uncharacterized membrane-anchored protein YhcB (DUF1043 family)
MRNSNLWLGLGIGLLVGAAVGAYYAASDEKKAEIADYISDKVDQAKKKIGEIVDQVKAHQVG